MHSKGIEMMDLQYMRPVQVCDIPLKASSYKKDKTLKVSKNSKKVKNEKSKVYESV